MPSASGLQHVERCGQRHGMLFGLTSRPAVTGPVDAQRVPPPRASPSSTRWSPPTSSRLDSRTRPAWPSADTARGSPEALCTHTSRPRPGGESSTMSSCVAPGPDSTASGNEPHRPPRPGGRAAGCADREGRRQLGSVVGLRTCVRVAGERRTQHVRARLARCRGERDLVGPCLQGGGTRWLGPSSRSRAAGRRLLRASA